MCHTAYCAHPLRYVMSIVKQIQHLFGCFLETASAYILAKQRFEISAELCAADAVEKEVAGVVGEIQLVGYVPSEYVKSYALWSGLELNRCEDDDSHEPRSVEKQEHKADKKKHCDEITIFRRKLFVLPSCFHAFRLRDRGNALTARVDIFAVVCGGGVSTALCRGLRLILHGVANAPYDDDIHGQQQDKRYGERDGGRHPQMYYTQDVIEAAQHTHELFIGVVEE